MSCDVCVERGIDRTAAGHCRRCSLRLCSEHLTEALRLKANARDACGHVFVATGWLASVVARASAAA